MTCWTDADLPVAWSFTVPSWKRYVRLLSDRSPLPIWVPLTPFLSEAAVPDSMASSAAWIASMASRRLLSRLRVWAVRTSPVGRWNTLAEFWCLFLCCPPAPDPLYHSTRKSDGSRRDASVERDVSPSTATVTVEEWTRPRLSFGGTRCTRCPPASADSLSTPLPLTSRVMTFPCLSAPAEAWHFQPSPAQAFS